MIMIIVTITIIVAINLKLTHSLSTYFFRIACRRECRMVKLTEPISGDPSARSVMREKVTMVDIFEGRQWNHLQLQQEWLTDTLVQTLGGAREWLPPKFSGWDQSWAGTIPAKSLSSLDGVGSMKMWEWRKEVQSNGDWHHDVAFLLVNTFST